jgi:hypothetical protein
MAAGLDSLGAVELRNALRDRLGGLQLPSTLLYDHQSISAIAVFILDDLSGPDAANAVVDTSISGGAGRLGSLALAGGGAGGSGPGGSGGAPSALLKLLRGAPAPRPLFLAAPGVANAQSAYVSHAFPPASARPTPPSRPTPGPSPPRPRCRCRRAPCFNARSCER